MHMPNIAATASKVIFLANLASAATNPDAKGACEPPKGGEHACGPNGSEEWLNTGVKGDEGWNPPFLHAKNVTHIPLKEYYRGVGSPCQKYDAYFKISGMKYDVDPAILAFIAMKESSCKADATGPPPGLMPCDPSNCQNGKRRCQYPIQENTDCGAHILRVALDRSKGNIVHALGLYNGWFTAGDGTGLNGGKGMTENFPCSEQGKAYRFPPDLNYLHEMLNGWFQGYDMRDEDTDMGGTYYCH